MNLFEQFNCNKKRLPILLSVGASARRVKRSGSANPLATKRAFALVPSGAAFHCNHDGLGTSGQIQERDRRTTAEYGAPLATLVARIERVDTGLRACVRAKAGMWCVHARLIA